MGNLIPQDVLDRVLEATDIVELVKESIPLKRSGRDFKGLCPFHQEKTPSFNVSSTRQIYKCFGCGVGGNAFSFVMEQDHCSFPEAVKALADRAGIDVPTTSEADGPRKETRESLEDLLRRAAKMYENVLRSPKGEKAIQYLHERKISQQSIERWKLGYAPAGWSFLLDRARSSDVNVDLLEQAGLVVRAEDTGRTYDRFRDRVMFPIHGLRGRVVGFGARCLDGSEPKYLNSPQTALFDKSKCLYGLFQAKQAIAKKRSVIIVEGYTDVIMAHQHGVENVVATLGTALTKRHIEVLRRFADEAVLVFDADTAGAKASDRSLEMFVTSELPVRIATLPAEMDPCDYCLQKGGDAFGERIEQAPGLFVYKAEQATRLKGDSPRRLAEAVDELLRLVGLIPGAVERDIQLNEIARRAVSALDIDEASLRRRFRQITSRRNRRAGTADETDEDKPPAPPPVEAQLIGLALADPNSLERIVQEVSNDEIEDDRLKRIHSCLVESYEKNGEVRESSVASAVPEEASLVVDLAQSTRDAGKFEQNLNGALRKWHLHRIKSETEAIRQQMNEAVKQGDRELSRELARKQRELQQKRAELSS